MMNMTTIQFITRRPKVNDYWSRIPTLFRAVKRMAFAVPEQRSRLTKSFPMSNDKHLYFVSDIVIRISGGQTMTVVELLKDGRYECGWFDGEDVQTEAFFGIELANQDPS
jgi:uncharacterized protein YodC (DUF2158 family)